MNDQFEDGAIQEVKDYLCDRLDEFDTEGFVEIDELPWLLTEEANSNGSITYSRQEAYEFLQAYPLATETIIRHMIEELGYDYEDIYYPDFADDDELDGSYEAYIRWKAESVQVILYIELARSICAFCPTLMKLHMEDKSIDLSDGELVEQIKQDIQDLDNDKIGF